MYTIPPRTLKAPTGVWFSCLTITRAPVRSASKGHAYCGVGGMDPRTISVAASRSLSDGRTAVMRIKILVIGGLGDDDGPPILTAARACETPPVVDFTMSHTRPAVVLLSGGLDSTTVLAIARRDGYEVNALSFSYGQRHDREIDAARRIANSYGVARHEVVTIDLRVFGGSALTSDIAVPKGRDVSDATDVPITYVPARNTIFLSYALAFAEVTHARDIFIGVNAVDYSGYPDCRPEYIHAFERM